MASKMVIIKELKTWVNHIEPETLFKKSFFFLQEFEFISNWLWDEDNELIVVIVMRHFGNKSQGLQKNTTALFINQHTNEIIKKIDFRDL